MAFSAHTFNRLLSKAAAAIADAQSYTNDFVDDDTPVQSNAIPPCERPPSRSGRYPRLKPAQKARLIAVDGCFFCRLEDHPTNSCERAIAGREARDERILKYVSPFVDTNGFTLVTSRHTRTTNRRAAYQILMRTRV